MIRTVRRVQLIAPATVTLLLAMAAAVTVAAVADPHTSSDALPGGSACVPVTAAPAHWRRRRNATPRSSSESP